MSEKVWIPLFMEMKLLTSGLSLTLVMGHAGSLLSFFQISLLSPCLILYSLMGLVVSCELDCLASETSVPSLYTDRASHWIVYVKCLHI